MCENYNYTKEYLYSKDFRNKKNILNIIINYNKIPLSILKFAILTCKDKIDNTIIDVIKEYNSDNNKLIDCILVACKVKLCTMKTFSSLCSNKCICSPNIKFKKLYKNLIELINENNDYLNNITFVSNFSELIKSTNVYDDDLYICIKKLNDSNINPLLLINLIVQSCLFTHKYVEIIDNIIKKNSDNSLIKTCNRVCNLITEHNKQCTLIESNIYISNIGYANNIPCLIDNSYDYIVSLTLEELLFVNDKMPFSHYYIKIADNTDEDFIDKTKSIFEYLLKLIGNVKILIHCSAGQSRSVIFTALLLKYKNKISFDKSLKIIKTKRSKSYPNPDIITQIKNKIKIIEKI
jgi:protein-tyrosine phosphatase